MTSRSPKFALDDGSERAPKPLILVDGSERTPHRCLLELPDGSERRVWSRPKRSTPQPVTTTPDPDPGEGGTPYAIQSIIAINANFKRGARESSSSYDPTCIAQYTASLAGATTVGTYREALEGAPTAAGGTWDWETNLSLRWLDAVAAQSWFKNYILGARFELLAGGVFDATWEAKVKYRVAKFLERFDAKTMCVITPGNEPDNPSSDGAWGAVGPGTDDERLDRYLDICRWVREEMHTGPRSYATIPRTFPHPAAIIGPTNAFTDLDAGGSGTYTADELLQRNGGEVLEYWDGYGGHFHTQAGTRIPTWDGTTETAPSRTLPSMYNTGLAFYEANAARVAAGKPEIWLPFTSTETGVPSTQFQGTWTSTTALQYLRRLRIANSFMMLHRYACVLWSAYSYKYSAKVPPDFNMVDTDFTEREIWQAFLDLADPTQYSLDRFLPSGTIPIPNKGQTEYWRPSDWLVYVNMTSQPTGTYPAYGLGEYNRVVMNGTSIACAAGGNNRLHMPIYLTQINRPFDLFADVALTGGGAARLCAYGYDKTKMLAEQTHTRTTTGTLNVRFTPVQHTNTRLPNPAYVDMWLEHNGTGTATFTNTRIVPA